VPALIRLFASTDDDFTTNLANRAARTECVQRLVDHHPRELRANWTNHEIALAVVGQSLSPASCAVSFGIR
jgi:hypothetical protein